MSTTVEYGTYVIDLCTAMLDNAGGLNKAQAQRVALIRENTIQFLTEYLRHESSSLPDLLNYLGKDATQPLQALVGHCDMVLQGKHGRIADNYGEAIVEIRDCACTIYDDIEDMRQNLEQLMGNLGMVQ